MAFYKDHKFSLIKFCKDLAIEVQTQLGVALPTFVDLDAHANIEELPKQDFIGMSGFALHDQGKTFSIYCGVVVSTWEDPDLVRLTEIMDIVSHRLGLEKQVPLYLAVPGIGQPSSWMVVSDDVAIDPVDKIDLRAIQAIQLTFRSGLSGH